jgi:hypothetical protein
MGSERDDHGHVIFAEDGHKANLKAALEAVRAEHDENPCLFSRTEGGAVRLRIDGEGFASLQEMDANAWHDELTSCAIWYKTRDDVGGRDVPPFPAIVKSFCGSVDLPLKILDRAVGVPIYSRDGQLRSERGYDEATRCYINPSFEILDVPDVPAEDDVDDALELLLKHALVDFPFSDAFGESETEPFVIDKEKHQINFQRGRGSRINALALLLQPFVRNMIDGPTPAYHIDKSVPGTGCRLPCERSEYDF